MSKLIKFLIAVSFIFGVASTLILLNGCHYELRYKYRSPIPEKSIYKLEDIIVIIAEDENDFQYRVKAKFGEEDISCMGFTFEFYDPLLGKVYTAIILLRKDDRSINLDWLGHEIFYHYMESEKGH